jgi:hypothetical protein
MQNKPMQHNKRAMRLILIIKPFNSGHSSFSSTFLAGCGPGSRLFYQSWSSAQSLSGCSFDSPMGEVSHRYWVTSNLGRGERPREPLSHKLYPHLTQARQEPRPTKLTHPQTTRVIDSASLLPEHPRNL